MAGSDPKSGRAFEPDPETFEADEDPLIELARIVSEDSGFSASRSEKPSMNRNMPIGKEAVSDDGLEAELLQELENSLNGLQDEEPELTLPPVRNPPAPAASEPVRQPAPRRALEEERDPDELLRSIEEQLGQFERRQAERLAAATASFAPPRKAEPKMPPAAAREAPPKAAPAAERSFDVLSSNEPPKDWAARRVSMLRPVDTEDESAPELPAWPDDEPEQPLAARPEYRFRGQAHANWDRGAEKAAEPDELPVPNIARPRAGDLPRGFDDDDSSGAELFVPPGKAARDRDRELFADDDAPETTQEKVDATEYVDETEYKAEAFRGRRPRPAAAAPDFDEALQRRDADNAAANASLSEALESDLGPLPPSPRRRTGSAGQSADRPRAATIPPPAATRRASAQNAPASGRGTARTLLYTLFGIIVVVAIGAAGALYLRSHESVAAAGAPPVIAADNSPVKVEAPQSGTQTEDQTVGDAIYNKVDGKNVPSANEQVVDNSEEPREVARIVLPPSQGSDDALARSVGGPDASAAPDAAAGTAPADQPADAQAAGSSGDQIGPRLVQTYTVRPDGTVVTSNSAPAGASSGSATNSASGAAAPQPAPAQQLAATEPAGGDGLALGDDSSAGDAQALSAPAAAPAAPTESENAPLVASTAPTAAAAAEPATAASGYMVQLSSQRSEDQAQTAYAAMQKRYASVLGKLQPSIVSADLGAKGIYYRVRVGPWEARGDAIKVCEALKSAGGSCFVTQ